MVKKSIYICISFVLALVITELSLRLYGRHTLNDDSTHIAIETQDIRILVLGDSTTSPLFSSWTEKAQQKISSRINEKSVVLINKGIPGNNTAFIASELTSLLDKYTPQVVITLMGINDDGVNIKYDNSLGKRIQLGFQSLRMRQLLVLFVKTIIHNDAQKDALKQDRKADIPEELLVLEHEARRGGRLADAIVGYEGECGNPSVFYDCHIRLGWLYLEADDIENAERIFLEAKNAHPKRAEAHGGLAQVYIQTGRMSQAVKLAMTAGNAEYIYDIHTLMVFADMYRNNGEFNRALEFYHQALRMGAFRELVVTQIADVYARMGKSEEESAHLLSQLSNNSGVILGDFDERNPSNSMTAYHFGYISDELFARGIYHIAVQYPRHKVSDLLPYIRHEENTTLVGNEENFESALVTHTYNELFTDRIDSLFGHTTEFGDELIAESVADAVVSVVTKKFGSSSSN